MQIDLIDFQSCPNGEFKHLLTYQCQGSKLHDNKPTTSKTNLAIAYSLLDLFTVYGVPAILQTDNGREFCNAAGSGTTDEACKNVFFCYLR